MNQRMTTLILITRLLDQDHPQNIMLSEIDDKLIVQAVEPQRPAKADNDKKGLQLEKLPHHKWSLDLLVRGVELSLNRF